MPYVIYVYMTTVDLKLCDTTWVYSTAQWSNELAKRYPSSYTCYANSVF